MDKSCRVYVGNLSWRVKWQDLKDHMKQAGDVVRADVFEDQSGRSKGCGVVEYSNPEDAQRAIKDLTDTELFDRLVFVREDREDDTGRGGRPGGAAAYGGGGGYGAPAGGGFGIRGGRGGYGGGGRGGYGGGGMYGGPPYSGGYGGGYEGPGPYASRGGGGYVGGRGGGGYGPPPYSGGAGRGGGGAGGYVGEDISGRQVFVSNLPWRTSWQDLKDLFRNCGNIIRADVMAYPDGRSKGVATVLFADSDSAQRASDQFNDYEIEGRKIGVKIDTHA